MDCDYVIVGGGASGCAVAARLAALLPAARIVLVESGRRRRWNPLFRVPALGAFAPFVPGANWNHASEPNPALGGRAVALYQGHLLGGSGAVNGMVATRGHPADYDAWRDAGCDGWGHADVLPFFRRLETSWRGAGPLHGGDGPIALRRVRPATPLPERFLTAAADAGYAIADDLAAGGADVFGLNDVNIAGGRRCASVTAYLGRGAPNLRVLTGHRVLDLVWRGDRVAGVRALAGREIVTIGAAREVILCAGAIKTAHLLLLSGIGPARRLEAAGVRVAVDSPQVGENLQNHPSVPLRYAIDAALSLKRYAEPAGALAAGLAYLFGRRGVLAEALFPVTGFVRTDPALAAPDAQIVMSPVIMPKLPAPLGALLPRTHGLTLLVQQGTPFSRGRVSLAGADPLAPPRIETGAFSDRRDGAVVAAAIARAAAIMARPAMQALAPRCESDLTGPEAVAATIRDRAGTAYHYCGTCRMDGPDGVTDNRLSVRGVAGLRIADGSVMPRIPNAALHLPTLMIAERAAALIAGDVRRDGAADGTARR